MEYVLAAVWKEQVGKARILRCMPGKNPSTLTPSSYLSPSVPPETIKLEFPSRARSCPPPESPDLQWDDSLCAASTVLSQLWGEFVVVCETPAFGSTEGVSLMLWHQVLECSWDELLKRVKKAEDLDHIIAAHQQFLDTINTRALLDIQSTVSSSYIASPLEWNALPPCSFLFPENSDSAENHLWSDHQVPEDPSWALPESHGGTCSEATLWKDHPAQPGSGSYILAIPLPYNTQVTWLIVNFASVL